MDGKWYCELHPEKEEGHDNCSGGGIPESARMDMLVHQRRNALQKHKEAEAYYGTIIWGLLNRINELEKELNL